jgi:tetratricopeptide (TPR) repeat protein
MANTYLAIREYDLAISCYEKCWVISRETNNQESIGLTLGNLGNIYFALENTIQQLIMLSNIS